MSKIDSPSKKEIIDAFQNCFLVLTEPEVKQTYPHVKKIIKEYADLLLTLEKIEMIEATAPEMRVSSMIESTMNTLEKSG